MKQRFVTWNINSVRLRIDKVTRFLNEHQPDFLCLQETKTLNDNFPFKAFHKAGYPHIACVGIKGYNGVAIVSKHPFTATEVVNWCDREDARHIYVETESGVEVHCLYVPAGGDIPDRTENSKFDHKLNFVKNAGEWFAERAKQKSMILLGDLNIAPLETDVWSHKQLLDVVSHTPVEVEHLKTFQQEGNWIDAVRHIHGDADKIYSWWSYRARDWRASNRGRRLDHIWVTQDLGSKLHAAKIIEETRDWEQPSDHVPVIVDLN